MKKLLVHLHLFYLDQWPYFRDKLVNIEDCDWDFFVTVCESENYEEYETLQSVKEEILKFKPDTKIIEVNNEGFDILPFLTVIKSVNLDDYDFVMKLHTKGIRSDIIDLNGIPFCGAFWLKRLVDSMLFSKGLFKQNLAIISKEDFGMVCDSFFFMKLMNYPEDTYLLAQLKQQLHVTSNLDQFLAGSMFMIRASILKRLQNLDLHSAGESSSGMIGTWYHAVERIFTILTVDEGYKIFKVPMFY